MSIADLNDFVRRVTVTYRKGEPIKREMFGSLEVITLDISPELQPDSGAVIDVHFQWVGFTEEAGSLTNEEFIEMIRQAETGHFASMTLKRLAFGPSYIELGGWLGSQDQALRFLALGEYYLLWEVMTPKKLFVADDLADQMAGAGYVMNSGLDPKYQSVGQ